jgi:hypothetical protein
LVRRTLKVIEGGGVRSSKWLAFPATVAARPPYGGDELCFYRIAREDALKAARAARRQPVFDLWSVVLGEPPRVPGVSRLGKEGLTCLSQAHACFSGVRRPIGEDDDGTGFLAYVTKPRQFYVYQPSMACVATLSEVPSDLVFVTYVKLDVPCAPGPPRIKGVITHWQFVESDGRDGMLPVDYDTRYDARLW